jgi:hypothetical protein
MKPEDLVKCKKHIESALHIMEREADTQPEVHVLICLRELMDDIEWLEAFEAQSAGNVVRLSDVRHLRALSVVRAAE